LEREQFVYKFNMNHPEILFFVQVVLNLNFDESLGNDPHKVLWPFNQNMMFAVLDHPIDCEFLKVSTMLDAIKVQMQYLLKHCVFVGLDDHKGGRVHSQRGIVHEPSNEPTREHALPHSHSTDRELMNTFTLKHIPEQTPTRRRKPKRSKYYPYSLRGL
jgi:hypothetical protein